jgi:hypothetical protein
LAGDAEAGEEHIANRCYTRLWMVINVPKLHAL